MKIQYSGLTDINGPLVCLEGVSGVAYDEIASLQLADGSKRLGRVLEIKDKTAVVQLFESSQGLQISYSKAKFLGHGLELAVSKDMIGRVFDGMGNPIDGGEKIVAESGDS